MEWRARARNYDIERRSRKNLSLEEVDGHPLKTSVLTVTSAKQPASNTSIDQTSTFEDPLSKFAAEATFFEEQTTQKKKSTSNILADDLLKQNNFNSVDDLKRGSSDDGFETWSHKQTTILLTFTTSQKLSLVTHSSKKEVATKALPTSVSEKVKNRLEQLDELEEGSVHETLTLTQEEYVGHINKLGSSLAAAWKEDQRVKTLKIAIQSAKLLNDTSSKQFYPSKFVIITEILDNFGHLVFERLLEKSSTSSPFPASTRKQILSISDIDPDLISDTAKETCRNWFFKIASIRELLPRIYIEASLLKCFDFLKRGAAESALERLVATARGVADPLVSAYLRCYLARVGDSLLAMRASKSSSSHWSSNHNQNNKTTCPFTICKSGLPMSLDNHLMNAISDTVHSLEFPSFITGRAVKRKDSRDLEDWRKQLHYFAPAVEWMLRCLARTAVVHKQDFTVFDTVFDLAQECKHQGVRSLMIGSLIDQLPDFYVAEKSIEFRKVVSELEGDEVLSDLYSRLGSALSKRSDPPELDRRPLLNDVWRLITIFERPRDYMNCASVWSAFVARHFGRKEVNVVMGDMVRKLTPDRAFESEQIPLKSIMGHFMGCSKLPLIELVAVSNFLPFLDIFEGESKSLVCKDILMKYSEEVRRSRSYEVSREVTLSDPMVTHTLMSLCKILHDQVTALCVDEEVRTIGNLINDFITTVVKDTDKAQLSFYVECRSSFCNIDPVLTFLVHKVNNLSINGKSSAEVKRLDGTFLRACSAYSFITIPSLNGVLQRLHLYLISGQVALQNLCTAQADSFFKSAIKLLPEVPRYLEIDGKAVHSEMMLINFLKNFCSSLIVLPDPPDQVPLFYFKELLSAIDSYSWDACQDTRVFAYCALLTSLATISQECLPYRVTGVDSDDLLYGSDPKFLAEVARLASDVSTRLLEYLESLERSKLVIMATTVFDLLVGHLELSSCTLFFKKLWSFIGSGNLRKESNEDLFISRNTFDSSVSTNVSKIVTRVREMAVKDLKYKKFIDLMLS